MPDMAATACTGYSNPDKKGRAPPLSVLLQFSFDTDNHIKKLHIIYDNQATKKTRKKSSLPLPHIPYHVGQYL